MANVLGLMTINGKQILEVDVDPAAGTGTQAPTGSMAMHDNNGTGMVYIKLGVADTNWVSVETPEYAHWLLTGNNLTGNESFGSLNDFDVAFSRNSIEQMRISTAGLLIGLNASMGGKLQVMASSLGAELIKQISPNGGSGDSVIHVSRQYKVASTDATPTVLASLLIPAGARVHANFSIGCNQIGGSIGSTGDGAVYVRDIDAKRLTTGDAVLKRVQTSFTSEDVTAFDVQFATSSNNINASVIGAANRNLTWMAHMEMTIFGN